MTNKLRRGREWLHRKLKQFAGESLVYSRGLLSASITAPMGKTLMRLDNTQGGGVIEWTDADFLILAADLLLGGVAVEPERGDKIRWTKDGRIRVFEVLPYGDGEPCWRWSDEHQTVMRIHAKQVE